MSFTRATGIKTKRVTNRFDEARKSYKLREAPSPGWLVPAGDGGDDGKLVAFLRRGSILSGEVADVVVVEVDVDEGAQLAVAGVEVLAERGVGAGELFQRFADGGAGDADGGLPTGVCLLYTSRCV